MKGLLIGLLALSSLTAFGKEVPFRLTDKNISTVKAFSPKLCTGTEPLLKATYKIVIKLVDGREISIEQASYTPDNWSCDSAISRANMLGKNLLNKLNNVANGDIQNVTHVEGKLICLKTVGNIVLDLAASTGANFEEQSIAVACPK